MEKDITISDIAIRAKSKKEIYHFLTANWGLYLPPIMDSNSKYIQNIVRGLKKFLYSKNIRVVKIPQIESLSIKELLKWGREYTDYRFISPNLWFWQISQQRLNM